MNSPELSLFVFDFIVGSYKGLLLAIAFIILFFKLNKNSNTYKPLIIITFCSYTILNLLEARFVHYIRSAVVYMFGPMADWIHGVNNSEVILTGMISTAIATLILGLRKIEKI